MNARGNIAVYDKQEGNKFRLENIEHEDADIDDLPLSFLQELAKNNLYTGNLKFTSKDNKIKNNQDTFSTNCESSKDTNLKNSKKSDVTGCLTSKICDESGNQLVENTCISPALPGGSYDFFTHNSLLCDIPLPDEVVQHDASQNAITRCEQINITPFIPKLVSQGIQYNKADCQIPQSVHCVQTSQSWQISQAIQCTIGDRSVSNISSSNILDNFKSMKSVNRCMCCKRNLEACNFLDIVDDSERILETNGKENGKLDSRKGDEQLLIEGKKISDASENPVTSSSKTVSPQVLLVTNTCSDAVQRKEVGRPLLMNNEMTVSVSSPQDHRGDVSIIFSSKDGDGCDNYLGKEDEKVENIFQLLSDDIKRNEISLPFEPVERADYVAKWINNVVPEYVSPPLSLAEEMGDELKSNKKISRAGSLQQCSSNPITTMKKGIHTANNCSGDTSKGIYQNSLSSSSTSPPERLRTRRKHCNKETWTSHNRRNILLDQPCKTFNRGEKNSVLLHLDVEGRNRMSSAIPIERVDYVATWLNNLNTENAPPHLKAVDKTMDVLESNRKVFKTGTRQQCANHQITASEKRISTVQICGRNARNELSQQSLSSTSVLSPEIFKTKSKPSNEALISLYNRDGESSQSSVPKSSNDELIHEFPNEDFEGAVIFEKFLASHYSLPSQTSLGSNTPQRKFLCSKTASNDENTQRQLNDNDESTRTTNCKNSQETESDSSSLDVRRLPKRRYIRLSSVEPLDNQKQSKKAHRTPYTMWERKKIIDYIVKNNKFSSTKGQVMWQDMERAKVCDRTWQSMKEHFRKQILPRIEYFHLDPDISKKFSSLGK